MEKVLGILSLIAGIIGVLEVIRRRKQADKAHPEVLYTDESLEATDPWRWRKPTSLIELKILDSPTNSRIDFPYKVEFIEYIVPAFGYLLFGFLLWGAIAAPYLVLTNPNRSYGELIPIVIVLILLGSFSWLVLQVGSRLVGVELTPTHIHFTSQFGIFLRRCTKIKRHPKMTFSGKYQSSLEMNEDQEMPEYTIHLKKSGLFGKKKRFLLHCDQTQGSWVVGGLQYWNDEVAKGSSPGQTDGL